MTTLILLTFNRLGAVKESVKHNIANAGYPIGEIVHIDNGSTDGVREYVAKEIKPDVSIYHKENLGVAKGYNAGYKLARGEFIAKPGTDMIMPDNWLRDMVEALNAVPKSGICGMANVSLDHDAIKIERQRDSWKQTNGVKYLPAKAIGSHTFRREILKTCYLPENMGLYGHDDILWEHKINQAGYLNFYIEGTPKHLTKYDTEEYKKFKHNEAINGNLPKKIPPTPKEKKLFKKYQ